MVTTPEHQVTLWIESAEPPVGRLGTPSSSPVGFSGWLDLLAQLSRLLQATPEPTEQEHSA